MSRPYGDAISERGNGLVHLGFWALWASAEGFGGYDRDGNLWKDQTPNAVQRSQASDSPKQAVREGVLQSVLQLVEKADKSRKTEILVVGHSLGGAVSW